MDRFADVADVIMVTRVGSCIKTSDCLVIASGVVSGVVLSALFKLDKLKAWLCGDMMTPQA